MDRKHLRHFVEQDIKLSEEAARTVLLYFFSASDIQEMLKSQPITLSHREFAQALLVEAVDASHDMGYVQILYESVFGGLSRSPRSIIERFGKKASSHWFKHAALDDLWDDPKIYESVRSALASRFGNTMRELLYDHDASY